MVPAVQIRLLRETYLAAAMDLKEWANWNQTEADWRRLLALQPEGCFAACVDNQVVGTATTTPYGSDLAWIGMVLVHPHYRQQGIATMLMQTTLDYLSRLGVQTSKLDATPAGEAVYRKLGFRAETLIERWEATAQSVSHSRKIGVGVNTSDILAFDRQAFGADRAPLLARLLADACVPPVFATTPDGNLRGYALARSGSVATYIGPLVAETGEIAFGLLEEMLGQLKGEKVYLDAAPALTSQSERLEQLGFRRVRKLVRMRYGTASRAGTSGQIYAIAGLETG